MYATRMNWDMIPLSLGLTLKLAYIHVHSSYMTLIRVHGMHGQVHPN